MGTDNLTELLLDLALSSECTFPGRDEVQILTRYVKKLDCISGAIFYEEDNEIKQAAVFPPSSADDTLWHGISGILRSDMAGTDIRFKEIKKADRYFCTFRLEYYGYLILTHAKPFPENLVNGLLPVVKHLGKLLGLARESEQKKAIEKRLESFTLMASKTTDVIIITDEKGYITYVNRAYENLTEYSSEEVIGKLPADLVHGEETDATTVNIIREAFIERKSIKVEILNYTKSGRKYWQSITLDPIFDSRGECIAFIAINKDITDVKRREKEFIQLSEFLTQTESVSRVGGWSLDLVEKKLLWSNMTREIHEVPPDYEPDLDTAINFYKEGINREIMSKALQEATMNGVSFDLEMQITTAKGKDLWVRAIGNCEMTDGHCTRLYGTFQEINEKKLVSIALEASEKRFRTIFELSATGIAIHRLSDGSFVNANPAFYKIIGYNDDDLKTLKPGEFRPLEYFNIEEDNLAAVKQNGYYGPSEKEYTTKKGRLIAVSSKGLVYSDQQDEMMIYSVVQDISEHKRTDERIRRKENMLRAIAASTDELLMNRDLYNAIANSLPIIGKAVDADRVYLFQNKYLDDNSLVASQRLEWNSGIVDPQIDNPEMQDIPIEIFGIFLDDLYHKKPFKEIVSQMPEGMEYKAILESQDIKSILIIPIFRGDFFWGLVGFDECKYFRRWTDDEVSILKSFTNSISIAIERFKVTEDLINLSLFPQENPNPLFRVDLEGNLVLRNKIAETIEYLIFQGERHSFADFARRVTREITREEPVKQYEVENEGRIYLVTSLLSENQIHINNYATNITELKKTQQAMERLSLVARANRHGVYFTGPDNRINYTNEAFLRITGFDYQEVLGMKPQEILHGPLTQQKYVKMLADATRQIESIEVDNILYRKDKTWFWANIKKQPIERLENGIQEYFSIIEDITEKKLAESVLKNSQHRLSSLVMNLKESILLEDENRRVVLANNNFCQMFKIPVSPEEFIGTDCSNTAEQNKNLFKNPDEFVERIAQIIKENKSVLSEELRLADGQYYERDYIPIIFNDTYQGHLWKYTDITGRKNQERTLKQQEEKYRNIIANMRMGLLETDNNDVINYVNSRFCDMSGYAVEELLGKKSIDLLVTEDFKPQVREKNDSRLGGVSDIYQVKIRVKNGEERWWLTSGGPNFNDKGDLIGTVGISVDITEQKILEDEIDIARKRAEESSHAKESFLANMSHEIRTPLNAIIGMIREISRESLSTSQSIYIKNAALASQHLLSIVNDILDITKIESGQINLDYAPFTLSGVISETISILASAANEKMLELSAVTSQMLAPAYIGDSNRIRQILINIISNSIKFTETGSITVECTVADSRSSIHRIHIKISDTGIGMDEAFLKNIFDKFSQGDLLKGRKLGGTGLGMAITNELVHLMGGTILVTSKVNVGTVTEIDLPLEVSSEKEIKSSRDSESFESLRHCEILLVEDNDLNRMVAENSLNYYGIIITEATNGSEAIELIKEKTFDLILMDLQMPVMGGIEATLFIRQEMKITTPIVALTAHAFKAEIDRCLNAGMNDYIIKPFEENTLMRTLLKNISTAEKASHPSVEKKIPENNQNLYDLSMIVKMSRGNNDFVNKMVQIFIEQTPEAAEQIKSAWEERDLLTIRRVAHRIKPNIDNFGIETLKEEIRTIESLADEGLATPGLGAMIRHFDKIINEVVVQLARVKF